MAATLEVILKARDQLTDVMKNTELRFDKVAVAANKMKMAFGAALVVTGALAAANGIKNIVNQSMELADKIDRTSKTLQMSAESTQRWDYVAKMAGGSIEQMTTGFQKLNVNAYAALTGTKEAQRTFNLLGVSLNDTNGNLKSTSQLVEDTILALSDIKNPTERAALAQKLFGRSGADLLPILSQGKDAIRAQLKEAEKYGQVMSNEMVAKLDEAGDSMQRMNTSVKIMNAEIAGALAPTFIALANAIAKAASAIRSFVNPNTSEQIQRLERDIKRIKDYQSGKHTWTYGFAGSRGDMSGELAKLQSKLEGLRNKKASSENVPSIGTITPANTEESDKEAEKALKKLNGYEKQVYEMSKEWAYADAQARFEAGEKMYADMENRDTEHTRKIIEARQAMYEDLKSQAEESAKRDWEIKQETIKKEKEKSELEKTIRHQTAADTVNSMRAVAGQWKGFLGAYKTMAIAQTVWDTYSSAQSAYKSMAGIPYVGPALGIAAAAAAVGAGLVNVAKIKAERFALGGDFITRGPQMIMVGDNPGGRERVQVTPISSPNVNGPKGTEAHFHFYDKNGNETDRIRRDIRSGKADSLIVDFMSRYNARFA